MNRRYQLPTALRTLSLSRANGDSKIVPTLSLDTEIRFRSAEERTAFIREFTAHLTELVRKYDSSDGASGASFRFLTASYPVPIRHEILDEVQSQNAPA